MFRFVGPEKESLSVIKSVVDVCGCSERNRKDYEKRKRKNDYGLFFLYNILRSFGYLWNMIPFPLSLSLVKAE